MDIKNNKITEKIYEDHNDYLILEANVINIEKQQIKIIEHGKSIIKDVWGIVLDKTIFHPQGGGQPSDKGLINDILVLTVREDKTQAECKSLNFI